MEIHLHKKSKSNGMQKVKRVELNLVSLVVDIKIAG